MDPQPEKKNVPIDSSTALENLLVQALYAAKICDVKKENISGRWTSNADEIWDRAQNTNYDDNAKKRSITGWEAKINSWRGCAVQVKYDIDRYAEEKLPFSSRAEKIRRNLVVVAAVYSYATIVNAWPTKITAFAWEIPSIQTALTFVLLYELGSYIPYMLRARIKMKEWETKFAPDDSVDEVALVIRAYERAKDNDTSNIFNSDHLSNAILYAKDVRAAILKERSGYCALRAAVWMEYYLATIFGVCALVVAPLLKWLL